MGAVNGKPEQTLHRIWRSALLVGFLFHRIFKKTEMDGEFNQDRAATASSVLLRFRKGPELIKEVKNRGIDPGFFTSFVFTYKP